MAEAFAFREFVRVHSAELQRVAWILTGDWAAAEDLVQDALIAAWPRWETLTHPDAPQLYVNKILIRTFLRGRRRRWVGEISTASLPDQPSGSTVEADLDLRAALQAALKRLPPRQRSVVALRYFADLTETETAAILGCSVGTVKAHCSKAFASLRTHDGLAALLTEGVI